MQCDGGLRVAHGLYFVMVLSLTPRYPLLVGILCDHLLPRGGSLPRRALYHLQPALSRRRGRARNNERVHGTERGQAWAREVRLLRIGDSQVFGRTTANDASLTNLGIVH